MTAAEKARLKKVVQQAAPRVWGEIQYDAGECSLDEAVELCMDADRPVACKAMSRADYDALLELPLRLVNGWAAEALKPYV